jgi:methionyl aminopeptidase
MARADAIPKWYWPVEAQIGTLFSMAIELFAGEDLEKLRKAGRAAAATLAHVSERIRPGVSSADIDAWVREDTARRGGRPSQLGYRCSPALPAFSGACCVSIDDEVCHGVPRASRRLCTGSIVNVDITTDLAGFHGDTSRTFVMGQASPEARHVVDVAERCLRAGIARVRPGARLGEIGYAIEQLAEREGCSVVRDYGGHGIGRQMHCEPHIPHVGRPDRGLRLKAGMVFTIEPMINLGAAEVMTRDDQWTVVTRDGSLSAQFEHTVLVTAEGAEVLTDGGGFWG